MSRGAGRPVLIAASPVVRAQAYLPTLRALADHGLRATVVDLPKNLPSAGRWLVELTRKLIPEKSLLIAHSNSTPSVLEAAATAPEQFAAVVLADPIGFNQPDSIRRVLARRALDTFREPLLSATGWPHVLYNVVLHFRHTWEQTKIAGYRDLSDLARQVRLPTLIAWGKRDQTMPPIPGAARAAAAFADSALHIEPDASHDWLITHPERFVGVIERFFGRKSG